MCKPVERKKMMQAYCHFCMLTAIRLIFDEITAKLVENINSLNELSAMWSISATSFQTFSASEFLLVVAFRFPPRMFKDSARYTIGDQSMQSKAVFHTKCSSWDLVFRLPICLITMKYTELQFAGITNKLNFWYN